MNARMFVRVGEESTMVQLSVKVFDLTEDILLKKKVLAFG